MDHNSKKIAFATCSEIPEFDPSPFCGDHLVAAYLESKGFQVDPVSWENTAVDWSKYSAVVIRSTFTYVNHDQQFQNWIKSLQSQGITVINHPELILWNMHKSYWAELEQKGVRIIPTRFYERNDCSNSEKPVPKVKDVMEENQWKSAIIKPSIGNNSLWTKVIKDIEKADEVQTQFQCLLSERDMMIQKYIPEVTSFGEWSLMFFDNNFSHAVVKQFSGRTVTSSEIVEEPPSEILQFAHSVVKSLDNHHVPVYSRIDCVCHNEEMMLMELELIECHLFLEGNTEAIEHFGEALLKELSK